MAEQNRTQVLRTFPSGKFSGTMVNGSFILNKESKERLEQQNVERCHAQVQRVQETED
jgi:hypothetical protein